MARRGTNTALAVITTIAMLVSVAVLTLATAGTPEAQAAGCGGGGGSPSPSASPSSTPSGGGGPNPTSILTIIPGGGSSSAGPSSSPSSSAASPRPSNSAQSPGDEKREIVPVTLQQDQRCKSTITISFEAGKNPKFTGRVGSQEPMCKRARKVTVKKVKRGKDATFGKAVTNAKGRYTVPSSKDNLRGRYYARVAKSTVEDGGATITCLGARSRTIRP